MTWKKISEGVEMFEKPCLGNLKVKKGERFMALCILPGSKKPYRGLARLVVDREGSEDVPGYTDKSILVVVESNDLLAWKVAGKLKINNIEEVIEKLGSDEKEFLGLEDPDIILDKEGIKHVYFTIPFKMKTDSVDDTDRYDVYVGHAKGNTLENLTATRAVLGKIDNKIKGFKEICQLPCSSNESLFLAETFVSLGKGKNFSAIGLAKTKDLGAEWNFEKLVHNPDDEKKEWCAGHSSPCRVFPLSDLPKNQSAIIMNGREVSVIVKGTKHYKKFRPGLFLFNSEKSDISWVDSKPLFEDPAATTITFASDVVRFDAEHCLIYAHVNDSFVRVYKVNYEWIRKRLPASLINN